MSKTHAAIRRPSRRAAHVLLSLLGGAALLALPAAAQADEPAAPAAAKPARALKVTLKIARTIDNRMPVDAGDRFTPGKLYLWSEVRGGRGDFVINHRWLRDGKTQFETPINVSGPRWRTWSYLKALPGQWKVEVTDEAGTLLGTARFVVQRPTQVSSSKQPAGQPSKQ